MRMFFFNQYQQKAANVDHFMHFQSCWFCQLYTWGCCCYKVEISQFQLKQKFSGNNTEIVIIIILNILLQQQSQLWLLAGYGATKTYMNQLEYFSKTLFKYFICHSPKKIFLPKTQIDNYNTICYYNTSI